MADVDLQALRERHLAAIRWEQCRAAWFTRIGNRDNATRCKLIAKNHADAPRDAAAGLKKNSRK